jgi:predicted RNA-binding Zn ribbon-like protein
VTASIVGGNLALDFVATVEERRSTRVEHLRTPHDLAAWFVAAGILDSPPAVTADELAGAIAAREDLFRVIEQRIDRAGEPLDPDLVGRLNAVAAAPVPAPQLSPDGVPRRTGGTAAALSAIARDGIALFGAAEDGVLKWCADAACTHPFLDRSRGHRRRWCGMAGCGDRAKAAAYRARKRARSGP